jgi:hypothetical protein
LCINFVLNSNYIDKIVIGVDNLSNLKENLDSLSDAQKVAQVNKELEGLRIENEQIILPTNWS